MEAMPLRSLGLFFAWSTFLSIVLVGHSTGINTKQWNEDKFIIYVGIERVSMQVCGWKSAPVDRHLHNQKQPWTRHESCPTPQFLFNYEALSCRKVVKNFLNLLVREEKNFHKWMSCLPACPCMGRYLCFEPVSRLLCVSIRLARAVTSALASPMATLQMLALASPSRRESVWGRKASCIWAAAKAPDGNRVRLSPAGEFGNRQSGAKQQTSDGNFWKKRFQVGTSKHGRSG